MLIFGHPWIQNSSFQKVFSLDDIKKSSSDRIILLEPLNDSIKLAQYCQAHDIEFAVTVNTITESIFSNALGSKYIVCQMEDADAIQSIAQEYLFDTKVLSLIETEKDIVKMAKLSIDGVIFPEAIQTR